MRSIGPARETFAAVALTGLTVATLLRCIDGRTGAFAGVVLTTLALAVLSRYRVSWDREGICYQTPFSVKRRRWTDLTAYSLHPHYTSGALYAPAGKRKASFAQGCRMHLHAPSRNLTIGLRPYSWQDIRILSDAVSTELPLRETTAVLVS